MNAEINKIIGMDYPYISAAIFKSRNIDAILWDEELPELPNISWYRPTGDNDGSTPTIMSAELERLMFLRLNHAKLRLSSLVKVARKQLTEAVAEDINLWYQRLYHCREYITRANTAVVLAMAKRTNFDIEFADKISEGNASLLRAIEKFDISRGFKFSTYACRAIIAGWSRLVTTQTRRKRLFPVENDPELERSDWDERRREDVNDECIEEVRTIVDQNLAELTPQEMLVIRRRFNWDDPGGKRVTLDDVGKVVGVTKERIRQIQVKALRKIKTHMENTVLDRQPRELCLV